MNESQELQVIELCTLILKGKSEKTITDIAIELNLDEEECRDIFQDLRECISLDESESDSRLY